MKINTNINAIRANLNLNSVQKKFADSTNRLSSGYRINKAADDAAGLAISQKMHAQIRGLHRASQNGSDGVSFIQTAEGALTEIESMLQRCRELSVQAANETNTIEDKKALQREIDSLRDEIDRLSSQTEYNTMSLLDGTCCRQSSCDNVGVSLVSASDDVPLTTYKFSVDQEATQATMTTAGINFKPDDVVTKDDEGSIQINGEIIKVKQGETYQDVYATIRDCCEMMNIDVVPVGNDGKECDLSDAVNLSFTSVLYGASQKIQITTDNANLAAKLGVNGAQEVQGQDAKVTGSVHTGAIFVDGLGVGDVGNIVLRDRQHLSEDGIMIVVMTLERHSNVVLAGPDIVSRGFVYVRESEDLMEHARQVVETALDSCLENNITDWGKIKTEVKDALGEYLWKRTKRNPMILPIIMEA